MSKKALLINDSRFESMILKDMLQRMDYTVEIVDEFEALYTVERFKPQLVICNYIMQQTRGDKLIQLLKAGNPEVNCLLSSNSDIRKSDFPEGLIDGIVHTPVSQFLLESVLKNIGEIGQAVIEEPSGICPNCKKDISAFEGIVFCPFCGTSLD